MTTEHERLPEGWRWDSDEGPWACHAIGPNGRAATVHRDGSLATDGRVQREVIADCYRRAERVFGIAPPDLEGPSMGKDHRRIHFIGIPCGQAKYSPPGHHHRWTYARERVTCGGCKNTSAFRARVRPDFDLRSPVIGGETGDSRCDPLALGRHTPLVMLEFVDHCANPLTTTPHERDLPCECGGKGWCGPCQARYVAAVGPVPTTFGPHTRALLGIPEDGDG